MTNLGSDPSDYQTAIERADSKQADAARARRHAGESPRQPERRLLPRVLASVAVVLAIMWVASAFGVV